MEKEIWKLLELYRDYLTDEIKKEMYVNWADEKFISMARAEEVEEEDLYEFLNQLSVLKRFIQRLVEQDKIRDDGIKPRKDLVKEITIVDYDTGKAIWWKNKYSETEQLLMYLAISEQPIELLCQILK